jgi:DNA adenine methylase
MNAPWRPALRYMGGKWRLAPWIIDLMPPHRTYVEPFGGAASVLLRKSTSYAEIYNDLDGEVVNLFRVLRDRDMALELVRQLDLTPWARDEFEATYVVAPDPIENARLLVARSFMGFGSTATALRRKTGFRADSNRSGKHPAQDWTGMPPALLAISDRLKGVVIENRPALDVMARFDGEDTLIYADPPYVHSTRSGKRIHGGLEHAYKHELTDDDHLELLTWLAGCKSMVMLSGYPHPLYEEALPGWRRVDVAALADGARKRTESLWINPAAQAATVGLFS